MSVSRHRDILEREEAVPGSLRGNTGENFLQETHIVEVNLTVLRTLTFSIALFFSMSPATTFHADRMTLLQLLNHFLLDIVSSRLENRTILDTFKNGFFTILELVFVCGSITDCTILFSLA